FTGFDRQIDGSLKALARPCIDTGMGLERLAFCVQGKPSPFHTDLFWPIVESAAHIFGTDPLDVRHALAYRVIADHARAATMLMSEGVIPSNVERGYVLRRLVRRAARYGQMIGHDKPFLSKLVPAVIDIFAPGYPELRAATAQVQAVMKTEEAKFLETLASGEKELDKMLGRTGNTLSGDMAFKLYETFGFPLELTKEICAQRGVEVNELGFKAAAEKASDIARVSWKGSGEHNLASIVSRAAKTEFTGYETLESRSKTVASAPGLLVLDKTPFYGEGGGQVGDSGDLLSADGRTALARVLDTQKQNDVIVHILEGNVTLPAGMDVVARVDAQRRARIKPHHTATHLLNEALKRVLGEHVRQAGSYVGPDKLRFDFTHPTALLVEELAAIEKIVNGEIAAAHPVVAQCHPAYKIQEFGATRLLGEDYGKSPRFLLIGAKGWEAPEERFSLELCGGVHVDNTSEILAFKITREASASSGVRRIEAIAGKAVEEHADAQKAARDRTRAELAARRKELCDAVCALGGKPGEEAGVKQLEQQLAALKANKLAAQAESGKTILEIKGLKVCFQRLDGADPKSLRGLSDKIKTEVGSGLVFLAAPGGGKLSFVLAATADLAAKGVDAAKIAKAFAAANGGSAGGRTDFAQGGAADGDWSKAIESLTAAIG
ncbi:MAG: alanine--tRNA ligase, partial [Elusimicrobiota bacterium]